MNILWECLCCGSVIEGSNKEPEECHGCGAHFPEDFTEIENE